MQVREGDILVCKKFLVHISPDGLGIYNFYPGQSYEVTCNLFTKQIIDPGKHQKHIDLSYNFIKFNNIKGGFGFHDNLQLKGKHFQPTHYIWDYFYTIQEYRKEKLNKININN